mgnify:CR=1 FL=1
MIENTQWRQWVMNETLATQYITHLDSIIRAGEALTDTSNSDAMYALAHGLIARCRGAIVRISGAGSTYSK